MFGLSRREQRWKAEQRAAETLCGLVASVVASAAAVRAIEIRNDADRLEDENRLLKQKVELLERASMQRGAI